MSQHDRQKAQRDFSRSAHRARSHDSAHENAVPPGQIPDDPMIPANSPDLINTAAQLDDLLDHLRAEGRFAYDSEFIGELTYHPKLCLIQTASAKRVSLIDPLSSELDLRPFWELICDASVEKIVHAGAQDIEPVARHLSRAPANIFDTQIAAGFAGMAHPVALSKLVLELVGAKLGKGLTFTHWDQRPLSAMQLRYAADDVRYLPSVRRLIGQRLSALGHEGWASEECASLCDVSRYRFDPDSQYLRVRGAASLGSTGLAILRELTIWRDAAAREHDLPPRAFLKDEVLIDLAKTPVKSFEKLSRVRGLPRPVEARHGAAIVEATLRALSTPADKLPATRQIEPSPTERFRADALWAAAQAICAGQSIDPGLVTNRQEIGEFLRHILSHADAKALPIMNGWRRDALGMPLKEFLLNSSEIAFQWTDGSLRGRKKADRK
jgi:ribonuclease D